MLSFKLKKKFVDNDRKEYSPGDIIKLDCDSEGRGPDRIKIDRMVVYGIIDSIPQKRRGRKPKVERAVVL